MLTLRRKELACVGFSLCEGSVILLEVGNLMKVGDKIGFTIVLLAIVYIGFQVTRYLFWR
jgi:hypothetical protein